MALTEGTSRTVVQGIGPVTITFGEAVSEGDLVGYSSGWKLAKAAATQIYARLVAAKDYASGETGVAYRMAVVEGFTLGTPGGTAYLSDTAGNYAESAGTATQAVGVIAAASRVVVAPISSAVATADIADDSVTKAKMAAGTGMKCAIIAGGVAGDHTVTGIATDDELIFVAHMSTTASIATIVDLTSEFTISAADTINNTAGTDTSSDSLWVFYNDLT